MRRRNKISSALIVGGGLAGILTAYSLTKSGISCILLDDDSTYSAWRAAAGIVNPIAGKRCVKTHGVENLLAALKTACLDIESEADLSFPLFIPKPIARIFSSEAEKMYWQKKILLDEYFGWISPIHNNIPAVPEIHAKYGCGIISGGGWVDIAKTLSAVRKILQKKGVKFVLSAFNAKNLKNNGNNWEYEGYSADAAVLSYGWKMQEDSFFSWLPFSPFKGEILDVTSETPSSEKFDNYIYNNGEYILPLDNARARIGATIEHDELQTIATEKAKVVLLNSAKSICSIDFCVTKQTTGIRPGIEDRYPVLGEHPAFQRLYIFNGLGGRGMLYAPLCAELLCKNIVSGEALPERYDVQRYYHRYHTSMPRL